MEIHAPTRKPKYFFCKITEHKKPILLKIPYASVLQKTPLSNLQGYFCRIHIGQDHTALEYIKSIEEKCLRVIKENNKKWFKNDLDEETIQGMFKSMLEKSVLSAYVSVARSHVQIRETNDITSWSHLSTPEACHVTLLCDGLFIYPEYFNLRWIVRGIKDFQEEEIQPDIQDIITHWEEFVKEENKKLFSKIHRGEFLLDKIKTQEFTEADIKELKGLYKNIL